MDITGRNFGDPRGVSPRHLYLNMLSLKLVALLGVTSASALVMPVQRAQQSRSACRATQMLFGFGQNNADNEPPPPSSMELLAGEQVEGDIGSVSLSEVEEAEVAAKLDALSTKWRKRENQQEMDKGQALGWGISPEQINGRMAMFFLITGLITEYYTGQSMPQQVYTLLQTLAIVEVSHGNQDTHRAKETAHDTRRT